MHDFNALAQRFRTEQKSETLIVAPTHRAGTFNSHAVDCPFVFTLDGQVGMTAVGWDGIGYQTGLTWRRSDGTWDPLELVFPRDEASEHRRHNAAITSILRDNDLFGAGSLRLVDGWYYATYHAYPFPGYEIGPGIVGIARSRDLRTWEEYGEVLSPAEGGTWEQGGLYKSWLLEHDGLFWIFYNAKNVPYGRWTEQTGAAVSDDLRTWRRVSQEPLLRNGSGGDADALFASDPCVLRVDDLWVMFYFGLDSASIGRDTFAVSSDLLRWEKSGIVLLDVGPSGSVDDRHAHKPAMLWCDGWLEHYYCAVKRIVPVNLAGYGQDEMRGIGVARSRPVESTA